MHLIGIHGLAQTGKTTAAELLANRLRAATFAFAEPITKRCAELLNVDHAEFLSYDKNKKLDITNKDFNCISTSPVTKRTLMQDVGRSFRAVEPRFTIDYLEQTLAHTPRIKNIIISDVRLPQEAEWVRAKGGTILHIQRPAAPAAHPDVTEIPLLIEPYNGDLVIKNDGTAQMYENRLITLSIDIRAKMRSKESIQRYERGDGIPKDYNMAKIAKFYGLKVSELWGKHQEQAQTSKIIARRQGAPADATGEYNNNIYKIGRHGFLYCHLNGEWRRSSNDAGQINKKLKRYAA